MNADSMENAVKALESTKEIAVATSGSSMLPLLKGGRDIAVVKKAEGKIKKNDVVLYKSPSKNRYLLHRVIRVKGDTLVIRGDNNIFCEYGITKTDIKGVMTGFYRDGVYHALSGFLYNLYVFSLKVFIYPAKRVIIQIKIRAQRLMKGIKK